MARWSAAFLIFDGVPSPTGSFLLRYVDPFYRKRPAGFVPHSQKCIRSSSHPDLRESERPGPVASPPVGYRLFLRSYALEKQVYQHGGFMGVSKGLLYDGFFSLPSPGS